MYSSYVTIPSYYILFGMPSLHLFTFLMFFKSCGKINWGQVICPLYRGSPLFGGSVIIGVYRQCSGKRKSKPLVSFASNKQLFSM